jgi:hypothetical protein
MVLAQILRKHGIGVRTAPAESTMRANVGSLDLSGLAMICLCALEVGAQAAHLRYACRRLRRAAPGIPVMVVFWPDATDASADRRLRDVVDADLYAGSTREAVQMALDQARPGSIDG